MTVVVGDSVVVVARVVVVVWGVVDVVATVVVVVWGVVVVVAITATPPIRALKTVNVDGTTREHPANQ